MSFDDDACFLCGLHLDDETTREHIFPKWLLHRNGLWDKALTLPNQTAIPYRQLTVPCCKDCNGVHLAAVEQIMEEAFSKGYAAVRELDEVRIFQWMAKIYYALQFKHLSLLLDRKNPNLGTMSTPEYFEELRYIHYLLQSVRLPYKFSDPKPWSIFVVKLHQYPDMFDYDFHDGFYSPTFAIRFGGIGILAHLNDNGTQAELTSDFWDEIEPMILHPLQWEELWVNINDTANRMNRVPQGISIGPSNRKKKSNEITVVSMPLQGLSSKPIYEPEDLKVRAEMLMKLWNRLGAKFSLDDVYVPPNRVMTMIHHEDGSLNHVSPYGEML